MLNLEFNKTPIIKLETLIFTMVSRSFMCKILPYNVTMFTFLIAVTF